MKALDAYREVLKNLPEDIRAAEVEGETEGEISVVLENGKHNGSSSSDVTALFVQTLGEKPGFTYTQKLDEDPQQVLLRAHETSFYAETEELQMHSAHDGSFGRKEEECQLTKLDLLWEKAEELERWLKENQPDLNLRHITVTDRVRTLGLVNSKGCDCQSSSHCFSVKLFAGDIRYPGFFDKELTFPELKEVGKNCFSEALKRWNRQQNVEKSEDFAGGTFRCVLDASVMNNMFLTVWRMFTEDNYQKNATPFGGKLHEKVMSPVLNMTDRVARKGSGYMFPMDCRGSAGRDAKLVTNGVLTELLTNSADKNSGRASSTGNAGRKAMISGNIHTDVVTTPKNFGVEPGDSTLEELMETMDQGVYIYESFDMFHCINTSTGDCSIPCNGIVVENGHFKYRVEGLTINGKIQDILENVLQVGNDTSVLPMLMLNSFTVASPSVLVEKLNVSR